ncbi:MAG: ABC transporter substrate-binding protein [Hyphomicrobiales bacterium]|nr:ABC transporter substrate-binding protein [Hyphomicrobiales bacterium]
MTCFRSIIALALAATTALQAMPAVAQTGKPTDIGVGIFTFTSGPAAAYGVPARNAAELVINQMNGAGGIGGVRIKPTYVDEAQGTDGVVAEFRRLASDPTNQAMIAALSSANCLALAPVAEQLKMPTFMWNCDTHQLFLKESYKYVYRPNSSTVPEFLAFALYLLSVKPDVKKIAIINPDYAFGRDAGLIFKQAMKALKPDTEIVAELYPKLGSPTFNTEISRLVAAQPDVIFSNLWGADLENFVRQGAPRELFTRAKVVLALGESALQRVGSLLPDDVIIGVLGDGWWLSPDSQAKPQTRAFVDAYRQRFNEYPVFGSFKMANSLHALKAVYDRALTATKDRWPTRDDLIAGAKNLKTDTLTGTLALRDDNDGLVDQIVGVTARDSRYPFPVMGGMVRYPAGLVTPPTGVDPIAWIGELKPAVLSSVPKPGSYK